MRERDWAIACVVTRDPAIIEWAEAHGLDVVPSGPGLVDRLAARSFDWFFSITNLAMIPEAVLSQARRGAVNFHDGPLPRFAGMYTPAWALLEGETEYGITFHEMTAGVDEGRILVQKRFPISEEETSLSLNTTCYGAAIEAFETLVEAIESERLTPIEQDLGQRSYYARHRRPEAAGLIDWSQSAEAVARHVRALDFGDRYVNDFCVAKVVHRGAALAVQGATAVQTDANAAPSTVMSIDADGWVVACGEGAVRLSRWSGLRGERRTPEEAARVLDVEIGTRLVDGEGIDRAGLTARVETTTPNESFWLRRLRSLDPIEAPFRSPEAVAGSAARVERLSLDGLAPSGEAAGPRTIAAFLILLARLQATERFDVTLVDPSLAAELEPFAPLFAADRPLRVALDFAGPVEEAVASIRAAIETTRKKGPYLVDLVGRHPELAADPRLARGLATSVAVGLAEDPDAVQLPAGSDLALFVTPDGAHARLVHDAAAIPTEAAERLAARLAIVQNGLGDATRPVAKLPLVDAAERRRLVEEWNRSDVDFDRSATLRSLFEAQVDRTPDAPAVVFEGESLSYAELDARANRLAAYLRGLGVDTDRLVGLHLARGIDMVVGVLGVLKAGGAYVPLDPVYPADRIAYMIEDARAAVVVTHAAAGPPPPAAQAVLVDLDRDRAAIEAQPAERPDTVVAPEQLAYVIYTSGSTGKPKGVMVEHRNVVNFFVGMDERVPHDPPGTWLAVTSLSFDISVLELLWTLTRGFEVVVFADRDRTAGAEAAARPWRPIDLGLALWGSDAGPGPRKYELMLEAAKFADTHGFCAVHTPERHFGAFGGPFPNPSVTSAAIAAVTERVQIRASSCVLPLHHPVRVAEEWGVVDNLSGGRVGISFASGWQPNDFVIRPEAFATAKATMFENAEIVRRLWRGEAVEFENPKGQKVPIQTLPRPVQPELPTWITTAGNVDTFKAAGAAGVNVLTHLLGQSLDELAEKVKAYRQAARDAGHDPSKLSVTCMLHTFVGDDDAEVRRIVREPMKDYLASSMALVVGFAWSFPAFERPGGPDSKPEDVDLASLSEDETDAILEFAFERYYETSGLFGTREACLEILERCKDADIDEIACLIDFGVDTDVVLGSLDALDDVRRRANERPAGAATVSTDEAPAADHSFAAQVERHGVTHMQCTPSHATMLLTHPESRAALGRIRHLMIGGEAFPVSLAKELDAVACGTVTNMYGPTETTIWSSTEPVEGAPDSISIGRPIANTRLYVLDRGLEPMPVGVAGELWIGGEGVVRGYHDRPELTAERFVDDPFDDRPGARMYATGDLARWTEDGRIDFLGRLDHQVKIRGYRIELGEIEARLASQPGVRDCVVIAREDTPGDVRLVAYVRPEAGAAPPGGELDAARLRDGLRDHLPEFMLPSNFVTLERFPQTPNGKVDRKALPAPSAVQKRSAAEFKAPESDLEARVAEVWKSVLYLEQIGVNDNFFDLGGHSLLVVQAHRKLRDMVPMPVSLTDLYRFPTVASLAAHLEGGGDGEATKASQARGAARREALGRRRRRGAARS